MSLLEPEIYIEQPKLKDGYFEQENLNSFSYKDIYFSKETGKIIGFNCCGLNLQSELDSVQTWLHEFTEMYLWQYPYMRCMICINEDMLVSIAHILSSLISHSWNKQNEKLSPAQFSYEIDNKKKYNELSQMAREVISSHNSKYWYFKIITVNGKEYRTI